MTAAWSRRRRGAVPACCRGRCIAGRLQVRRRCGVRTRSPLVPRAGGMAGRTETGGRPHWRRGTRRRPEFPSLATGDEVMSEEVADVEIVELIVCKLMYG